MPRPSFLTLVLAAAVAQLLVATAPANALQGMDLTPPLVRRSEHVNFNKRMIRKRQTAADDEVVPVNPAADVPNQSTTTLPASTSTPAANGNGNQNSRSSTSTTSTGGGLLDDLNSLLNPSTTSKSTQPSSSSTSSTSSTSSSSASTSSPSSSTTPRSTPKSTAFATVTADANQATESTDQSKDENASFLPKSVIIGLIVAGSCVVAGAAIWTIIRKWKFSPSRHFEDRLEPISWEPTQSSGVSHDPTMAALGRAASRNGGRPGSVASSHEYGSGGSTRNMTSTNDQPISMTPDFPPAHDFTAGPAGGLQAGYVDMHRGPSPGPYGAGPGAGGYGGQYETPNPYDAYDYNNPGYSQQRRY